MDDKMMSCSSVDSEYLIIAIKAARSCYAYYKHVPKHKYIKLLGIKIFLFNQ